MSKVKSRYPTRAEIERAIEAAQRSGLCVTGVRAGADGIYLETRAPGIEPTTNVIDADEWKAE
jgi:hypothetical protein